MQLDTSQKCSGHVVDMSRYALKHFYQHVQKWPIVPQPEASSERQASVQMWVHLL